MKKKHRDNFYLNKRHETAGWTVTRRDFLKTSAAVIAGLSIRSPFAFAGGTAGRKNLCFGIVTDPHYADADTKGSRYYRESLAKMSECVALMNDKKVNFLVELGDFKDENRPADENSTIQYLHTIEATFKKFNGPSYHVLGNHDMDSISKTQFLNAVRNTDIPNGSRYYSFDSKDIHFIVLDANYRSDGSDYDHGNYDWTDANIPPGQMDWLGKDLDSASNPVIVFVHQRLDGEGDPTIRNAADVRQILHRSNKVLAVFQGHHHSGAYSRIDGIHYYTLKAMVEGSGTDNNSYAVIDIHKNLNITVTGYRRALSSELEKV
ncbi:metallophosphoesterase [candidate division KSB1 bacterium]|nr:metallophosphoesterase [candidate division KSB1 bacterium]